MTQLTQMRIFWGKAALTPPPLRPAFSCTQCHPAPLLTGHATGSLDWLYLIVLAGSAPPMGLWQGRRTRREGVPQGEGKALLLGHTSGNVSAITDCRWAAEAPLCPINWVIAGLSKVRWSEGKYLHWSQWAMCSIRLGTEQQCWAEETCPKGRAWGAPGWYFERSLNESQWCGNKKTKIALRRKCTGRLCRVCLLGRLGEPGPLLTPAHTEQQWLQPQSSRFPVVPGMTLIVEIWRSRSTSRTQQWGRQKGKMLQKNGSNANGGVILSCNTECHPGWQLKHTHPIAGQRRCQREPWNTACSLQLWAWQQRASCWDFSSALSFPQQVAG